MYKVYRSDVLSITLQRCLYEGVVETIIEPFRSFSPRPFPRHKAMIRAFKQADTAYIAKRSTTFKGKELNLSPIAKANEMIIQGSFDEFCVYVSNNSSLLNDIEDKTGKSVLHTACDEQRVQFVDFLAQQPSINVNLKSSVGYTALHYACKHNLCTVIELLLQKNISINAAGEHGNTPLMLACRYGNLEAMNLLLKNQVDVNIKNSSSESALSISIKFSYIQIAEVLLTHGADINIIFPSTGDNLLTRAIFDRNSTAIDFILKHNIDLSARNNNGYLAFHAACIYEQYDIADRIIASYGTIDDLDNAHRSVLIIGCMGSSHKLVEYALERRADVNIQDIWGYTALMFSITTLANKAKIEPNGANQQRIFQKLLQAQPHLDIVDMKKYSALMYACKLGLYNIAETLIKMGADKTIKNQDGLEAMDLISNANVKANLQSI